MRRMVILLHTGHQGQLAKTKLPEEYSKAKKWQGIWVMLEEQYRILKLLKLIKREIYCLSKAQYPDI